MCGICGIAGWTSEASPDLETIQSMVWAIRHRGPDELSVFIDGPVALGHARLAILDLAGGGQPMPNEDDSLWIVYNGEIYNYLELMPDLRRHGHRFKTRSDTEVLLHLYEQYGAACLDRLNGAFAFAIWDCRKRELFLARDRFGERPLYFMESPGGFAFASEIKSLFTRSGVSRALDPAGLDQVFTFWSAMAPRTLFEGVHQIPPGHYLLAGASGRRLQRYWQLEFPAAADVPDDKESVWAERLEASLTKAVHLRMHADVPIGAYLSGGLDSSLTAALVKRFSETRLETFGIGFEDAAFDETPSQERMAASLGTSHHRIPIGSRDLARELPAAIRQAETVILRTAPIPLLLLSRAVTDAGIKVVVTGEGADELLAGYNIFKENRIRRLWAEEPESPAPRQLLSQLYPYLTVPAQAKGAFWQQFFATGLHDTADPCYSHAIRWHNTSTLKKFFSADIRARLVQYDAVKEYAAGLPPAFPKWDPLSQAQYIEITTFMSPYLLSSQGDRMAMGNGVENRLPFLDPALVELAVRMPPSLRLKGMEEKYLLRRVARRFLPPAICERPKRPYRAPISAALFAPESVEKTRESMSEKAVADAGLFAPAAVAALYRKLSAKRGVGVPEREDMAVAGILSAQLLHQLFIVEGFKERAPDGAIRIVHRKS